MTLFCLREQTFRVRRKGTREKSKVSQPDSWCITETTERLQGQGCGCRGDVRAVKDDEAGLLPVVIKMVREKFED